MKKIWKLIKPDQDVILEAVAGGKSGTEARVSCRKVDERPTNRESDRNTHVARIRRFDHLRAVSPLGFVAPGAAPTVPGACPVMPGWVAA